MATWANLQSALSNGPNVFGKGRTIGAPAKARIDAWFESQYGHAPTADDISEWLARHLSSVVLRHEEAAAIEAANITPAQLSDD